MSLQLHRLIALFCLFITYLPHQADCRCLQCYRAQLANKLIITITAWGLLTCQSLVTNMKHIVSFEVLRAVATSCGLLNRDVLPRSQRNLLGSGWHSAWHDTSNRTLQNISPPVHDYTHLSSLYNGHNNNNNQSRQASTAVYPHSHCITLTLITQIS